MHFSDSPPTLYTPENTGSKISMRGVIGGGYDEFWRSKARYVVCKGSRASKKSTTAALKLVVRLMQMPLANALVVRQTAATLKDSCYAQLKWAINRLGVDAYWKFTVNPLQMTYLPTGQKIIFRGCDDSLKITSIAVEKGHLCFAWCEEAFEVMEADFNKIDESLRGQLPEGYYIQWLITFNPWASCWLKTRFFDTESENVLAVTTNYKCNEWLSENDLALFEEIRETDPDRYKVVGLGDWGVASGQYFPMWKHGVHVVAPFEIPAEWMRFRSMDFGQAKPYAVLWFAVDFDGNLYAYRELYGWGGKPNVGTGETAQQIGERIAALETPEEGLRYGVLDSACWARTGVSGPTIEEELNRVLIDKKLVPFSKSSKGRLEGADAFKQRLIGNTLDDGTKKPAIYFFATCVNAIRTIPMIGHDKHKPELPDTDAEDHCFIAGTMIHTLRGEVPIEKITTRDKVLTRKGFRKVLATGLTKRNAHVLTVTLSNGRTITGTGNHPIFIKGKGFITLDTVSYGDIMYSVSEVDEPCRENNRIQQILSCSTGLRSDATRTRNELATGFTIAPTAGYASKVFAICTEKYGSFTTAKSLQTATSITRTATRSTTPFQTLNCLTGTAILHSIGARILKTRIMRSGTAGIWTMCEKKPPNGTVPKKDANGTDNTRSNAQSSKLENLKQNACASNAEKSFTRKTTGETPANIVQKPVAQNTGATMGLTTRQEFVRCVGKNLGLIGSAKPRHVAENAVVSVVRVTEEKRTADVYNLTVDGEHEYFANGFLVHNCMDAVIYACMSRPWKPVKKDKDKERPKPPKPLWTY